MNTESILTAQNVTRRYGSGSKAFTAVDDASLEVHSGELFAILGTNGAGKTSLMEVLEGLAPAASGSVKVWGMDPIADRTKIRPRTAIMLQEAGFPSDLTVKETAQMWAGTIAHPLPIEDVLEQVELSHRADVKVPSLSGGERRRLDLALALMNSPELLFLDEPTTGLDPESRQTTWRLVRELLNNGTSVVLTTHYLAEAEALADRLIIMHEGKIVRSGTPTEIVADMPSTITFTTTPETARLPLADLPHLVEEPSLGTTTSLSTSHLQSTLTALLAAAQRDNTELDNLQARSADLEQAFLAIAGRFQSA